MKRTTTVVCLGLVGVLGSACGSGGDSGSAQSAESAQVGDPDLTPAYWDVDADVKSPTPGSEPINVILTLKNIQMDDVISGLKGAAPDPLGRMPWTSVGLGTNLTLGQCISAEKAIIEPTTLAGPRGAAAVDGKAPGTAVQQLSYRLGGCFGIGSDGESHARAWESPSRRKCVAGVSAAECASLRVSGGGFIGPDGSGMYRAIAETTWYLALSQEHPCTVNVTTDGVEKLTPWHCILPVGFLGITGLSIKGPLHAYESATGGYNQGRDDFVADLQKFADLSKGAPYPTTVVCESLTRPAGEGLVVPVKDAGRGTEMDHGRPILKRVTWDTTATHCTITGSHPL